ncbi:hypothetical protein RJT34_18874 [Clitoria ternatea]|uniref:CRIB domain-containing protein n=1 Tax=Clitoria ternatea TaxID=43366 RepID=A0AAN9P3T7_CLITE
MSNHNKVKGILKGLRFISQIFDGDEKESEIEIGHPTDVKHVAHIGWDGPAENAPSWKAFGALLHLFQMGEYKSVQGFSSAPLSLNRDIHCKGSNDSFQWDSEDAKRRGSRSVSSRSQEMDITELPKSSKQHTNSTGNVRESHAKEKSDRPRQGKKSSKHLPHNGSQNDSNTNRDSVQSQEGDLPPKKNRSKASSKDGSKSRSKAHHHHRDPNSTIEPSSGSSHKSRSKNGSFDEDGHSERGSNEDHMLRSCPN